MDDYSLPATITDLLQLIQALNKEGVEYLLVGGYALHAHGYTRATEDIDFVFRNNKDQVNKIKMALAFLPDQSAEQLTPAVFDEHPNVRIMDAFIIDIMTNVGGLDYEALSQYQGIASIGDIDIKTISLEGILKTKENSLRAKDIDDCRVIRQFLTSQEPTKKKNKSPSP